MKYGRAQTDRVYFSSGDIARQIGVPLYQVARWETRFNITHRKNRAGKRIYLDKEVKQFHRISELIKEGKETHEILTILNSEDPQDFENESTPLEITRESISVKDQINSINDQTNDQNESLKRTLIESPSSKNVASLNPSFNMPSFQVIRDQQRLVEELKEVLKLLNQ